MKFVMHAAELDHLLNLVTSRKYSTLNTLPVSSKLIRGTGLTFPIRHIQTGEHMQSEPEIWELTPFNLC